MNSGTIAIDFTTLGKVYGPFRVDVDDDLHYRFERTEGASTLTGTLNVRLGLADDDLTGPSSALTLDGTIKTVDVSKVAFAWFVVGTAQSGYKGNLRLMSRPVPTIDGGGA